MHSLSHVVLKLNVIGGPPCSFPEMENLLKQRRTSAIQSSGDSQDCHSVGVIS